MPYGYGEKKYQLSCCIGEDDPMLFSMNAQDLLDGLNIVTRALSARPSKQILEGVLLDAGEDSITLLCTDGSLSIETVLTAQIKEPGQVVLPGKLFTEIVRKLPGGDVTIKVNDNHAASIRCMSFKGSLAGMNAVDFPAMASIEQGTRFDFPQNKLRDMISHVVFAIATDESRQILTGCLLEVTSAESRLVALDGFRLAMQKTAGNFQLPEGVSQLSTVIPGRVLSELGKVLLDEETPCALTVGKGRLQANFGNTCLNTVTLAGEYIDYRKILPSATQTLVKVSRVSLQDAIDRASLMAREGKNNLIRIHVSQGNMQISSNAEMGDAVEDIACELQGEPIEIAFNAKYISDVIRNITDDSMCMRFNSNVSPCVVCPPEGDDYLYLILPVRIFQ